MVITACASGCGRRQSSDTSSTKFLMCSKCKLAKYCSKTCQIEHWKEGGHKYDCFTPEANAKGCDIAFIKKLAMDVSGDEWDSHCEEARKNMVGCSVFLGANEDPESCRSHPYMILTDLIEDESNYTPIDDRLFLPKVPPALLRASWYRKTTRQQDLCDQAEADELCEKFASYPQNNKQDILKCLIKNKKVWKSVLHPEMDDETRAKTTQYLVGLLEHHQWTTRIAVPQVQQNQNDSLALVGKKIALGGGIEAIFLTAPGIGLADLSQSQKTLFAKPPVLRLPVVIYRSKEEGLYDYLRVNTAYSFHTQEIEEDTGDAAILKIFVAGAEIGDLGLLLSPAWNGATHASLSLKQEWLFARAAKKLIALLHPHHKRYQVDYLIRVGMVYEALASRLLRDQGKEETAREALLSAALTYKTAADLTLEFYPYIGWRLEPFEALAVALLRLGDSDMAARAFIWACTDPTRSKFNGENRFYPNMKQIWEYKLMSVDDRTKWIKRGLKEQRNHVKSIARSPLAVHCRSCGKSYEEYSEMEEGTTEISRCGRCFAPYCSRACQKDDWETHREICVPATKNDPGSFEQCTHCPDETRAMLSNIEINKEFGMSLSAWSEFVDECKAPSNQRNFELPTLPDSLRAWLEAQNDKKDEKLVPFIWDPFNLKQSICAQVGGRSLEKAAQDAYVRFESD